MYKDKDKQREANRERQRRYKARQKALPEEGVTDKALPNSEPKTIEEAHRVLQGINYAQPAPPPTTPYPSNPKRGLGIKCFEDLPADVQATINRLSESNEEKAKRTAAAIKYQHLFPGSYEPNSGQDFTRLMAQAGPGHVRVSKPGDEDYQPQCETSRRFIDG